MKKLLSIITITLLSLTLFKDNVFADEEAYARSLAKTEAAIDYLNEVYLDKYPELGFDIDYCSDEDIELLTALANYITEGCSSDIEKAKAIYDWMVGNISYGLSTNSFSPIDVYKNREGVCSGHSQLMSTLFRVSGIPAAVIRCSKQGTNEIESMEWSNYYIDKKQHEFVMAYVEDGWYGYDSCWQWYHMTKDRVADQYVVLHVDGILPYSESWLDYSNVYTEIAEAWYKDGEFISMRNGTPVEASSSKVQLGGCLSYAKYFYNTYSNVYYKYEGDGTNKIGNTFAKGYYFPQYEKTKDAMYFKANGVLDNDFYYYNGDLYFRYVKIGNCIPDIGLTNNKINMYIGETIDFSSIYPGAYLNGAVINNIYRTTNSFDSSMFTFEGQTVTANKVGEGAIKISYGSKIYTVDVQVIDYIGDELTQELCDHDHTHMDDEVEVCSYCGKEIEEEVIETVEEPVIEEPIIEEVVEEPVEEVVETLDETIEEVVQEEVVEEQVEEVVQEEETIEEQPETVEEVVEQEVVETIEESETVEEVIEELEVVEPVMITMPGEANEPRVTELAPVTTFNPANEITIEPVVDEEVIEVVEEKEVVTDAIKSIQVDLSETTQEQTTQVEETKKQEVVEQNNSLLDSIVLVIYSILDFLKNLFV